MDFSKVTGKKATKDNQTKGYLDAVRHHKHVQIQVADSLDLKKAQQDLAWAEDELKKMKVVSDALVVKDEASLELAVSLAGQAKLLFKKIEGERKVIIEKPYKFFKAINSLCKKWTPKLTDIENSLKRKIGTYKYQQDLDRNKKEKAQADAREELQKTIDKQAEDAGVDAPQIPAMAPIPKVDTVARSDDGSSAFIKQPWVYEITDEEAIPREYCVPNPTKIKEAIKAGIREIPGVKIFQDVQTTIRT